jgi:hypothetical protein
MSLYSCDLNSVSLCIYLKVKNYFGNISNLIFG